MNQKPQKLLQLINQESELANNLLALMQQEKATLENNQHDKLNALTCQKGACLDQIEQISRKRTQLLLALSTAPSTADRMNDFISRQTEQIKHALQSSLDKLEQVLEQCRQQNAVNGMIISMSQRNVQRNLNILKGVDRDPMTYTPKGQASNIGQSYDGIKV